MRGKTGLLLILLALTFLFGTFVTAFPVKASPGEVKLNAVYRTASGYYPGQAPMTWLYVTVDIEVPYSWDLTSDGIVGWTFDVHVDPSVLTVWTAYAASLDYYLFDFCDWNMFPAHSPSILIGNIDQANGDITDIAEFLMGYETLGLGAGGNSYPEDYWYGMGYGLCRLRFRVLSETAYSLIDISDAAYWTPDGVKHLIPDEDITDGHYNAEPVPEFPLGAAVEVGLIVAVAYIWWTRRRKLQEVL